MHVVRHHHSGVQEQLAAVVVAAVSENQISRDSGNSRLPCVQNVTNRGASDF